MLAGAAADEMNLTWFGLAVVPIVDPLSARSAVSVASGPPPAARRDRWDVRPRTDTVAG